jgi:membrane protein YdbS with pleckstrin-like domain
MANDHFTLWENIQVFWWSWDLEIVCGFIFVVSVDFAMRWLLWRYPSFFSKHDDGEN